MPAEDDPAALAATRPEPVDVEDTDGDPLVHAVGVGPGPASCRTARANRLLATADVVVGFETVLAYVEDGTDAEFLACSYADQTETLATFADRVAAGERGVVAFMGDPNVSGYQFLGRVERAVDGRVTVVPGVSSIQMAASRARVPFERATFASLHQRGDVSRELDRLAGDAGDRHLVVLPRPYDLMPGDVAGCLLDAGVPDDLDTLVYERLAHEDEARRRTTLAELAEDAGGDPTDAVFSDLSVLVVRASPASP